MAVAPATTLELPADVTEKAAGRLGLLAGLVAVFSAAQKVIDHGYQFATSEAYPTRFDRLDLIGVTVLVAISATAFGVLRSPRIGIGIRHKLGVAYLICVAYLLSLTDHADYFWRDHHTLHGAPYVALLILVFPVVVPMRVHRALAIAGTMAVTGPLALLTLCATLDYEYPDANVLMDTCPIIAVAVSGVLARYVHQLGVELKQARQLGQYTLGEKLGEGGMGMVFRASHAMLRRPTAVKLLLPDRAGPDTIARFEREVQLTSRLSHPNTVRVHDYGRTPDGIFYYAMELLDGPTLGQVVAVDGPQDPARVAHILEQVAGALREAHDIGLIHRDIKPSNIVLCEQSGSLDMAKVVDFGLVKQLAGNEEADVTNPEVVTGTPLYMSPEAITGPDTVDGRSDLYGLGAVAYYLLTGTHLFSGNTLVEICSHHLHTTPQAPSARLGAALPEDLERLVLDCLAKRPDARPRDAAAFLERLRQCTSVGPWQESQGRLWWKRWHDELRHRVEPEHVDPAGNTELQVDLMGRV